jgi:DNA-binding NarL/FixJ family response regulator
LRVLIGENNADLAMTLVLLLEDTEDIRCVARASSNKAVMEALELHAPNAFVLDLSLDDGSSLPLIAKLRERLPAAAIVVYTGHKSTLLEQQCLKAGADAMVVKGGEIEELTDALRRAAQRSSGR